MAQIQRINRATATTGGGTSTSLTINKPTDTQSRDLMIAVLFVENNADILTVVPSGWDEHINASVGTRAIRIYVFKRIAGLSEPSSYEWQISSAREICGYIVTYRGVNQSDPIAQIGFASTSTASSASLTAPGINKQYTGNMILFCGGNAFGTTYISPPGWSEHTDIRSNNLSTSISLYGMDNSSLPIGATGDITATAANADYRIAALVEINADRISGAGGIASSETVNAPGKIINKITAVGAIASLLTFGTAKVSGQIIPWGNIETGEALGTAKVSGTVLPGGVASGETFGTLAVKPVTNSITPGGISGAEAFGTTALTGYKRCGAIPSKEVFGTPNVRTSIKILSAGDIASAEVFGNASIVKASWKLCGAIPSAEAFGSASVVVGAPGVHNVGGIASAEAFGSASILGPLVASGIASQESFGLHWVFRRDYCGNIASEEVFGSATIISKDPTVIRLAGAIASVESLGSVNLLGIIGPPVIPSEYVSGSVKLNGNIHSVGGISAPSAFGFQRFSGHIQSISGIASAEGIGTATVVTYIAGNIIAAGKINSEESFGAPSISGTIVSSGIATGEIVPEPAVKIGNIRPDSIASGEAFGTTKLNGQIIAVGIVTSEAVSSLASVADYVITNVEILELVSNMFTDIELVSGIYDEIELSSDIGGD